jgi:glycosyltransferase involved in cell wall biosynthesis
VTGEGFVLGNAQKEIDLCDPCVLCGEWFARRVDVVNKKQKILVYEPSEEGHFPFFLELVVTALRSADYEIVVVTDQDSPVVLPDDVMRVSTVRRVCPSTESVELAKKFDVQHIFYPCLEHIFWSQSTRRIMMPPENIKVHGIIIGVGQFFNRDFFRMCDVRYRRTQRLVKWIKELQKSEQLGNIFVIDERTIKNPERVPFPTKFLADPFRPFVKYTKQEARYLLGLPQDRTIYAHLGSDERRKGLLDVMRLIDRIEHRPPLLVRGGKMKKHTFRHKKLIERLVQQQKFIHFNEWISEEKFDLLMDAADYVLLSYHSHNGSSGVLSRAIGHGTPVIASDYKVIGERVKKYNCGFVYPDRNMKGLGKLLAECAVSEKQPRFSFPIENYMPERFICGVIEKFLICA